MSRVAARAPGDRGRKWIRGRPASPGIGLGAAYVIERRDVQIPHARVPEHRIDHEVQRLLDAITAAKEHLQALRSRLGPKESRSILNAQQMMLTDPTLIARTEAKIREDRINAEWALVKVTDALQNAISVSDVEYLRERREDIIFIRRRLLRTLRGEHADEIEPPPGAVVVAHDLSPAETAQFSRTQVAGIVTEVGGPTSHSAIMARALGIPAVVGVESAGALVRDVNSGDAVIVDGTRGRLFLKPDAETTASYRKQAAEFEAFEEKFTVENALPTVAQGGLRISLRANLAFAEELDVAIVHGAEGVGLYRTEYMYMDRDTPPREEEHYRTAKGILARCAPHPVVFRTFDLGADKACHLFPRSEKEANPAMGMRSIRLSLRHRELFLCQLRGLLRAAVHGPARLLLPFISGIDELHEALAAIDEAREQLEDQGLPYEREVEVGVMVELPSAVMIADVLAQHVDFMSLGTNDLIQYALAIDRENEDVGYLYQPLHPGVLRMIHHVCQAGQAAKIPVSLCGEMASDPRYAWILVGLGVHELSVHPAAIPLLKNIIRASHEDEMREFAQRVLRTRSVQEARATVEEVMGQRFPEHLLHGTVT